MVWIRVEVDRPVLAEAVESTGTGVAAQRGAMEAESALTMKPNGAENWVGPASRRRDNIGAPAVQAFIHINTQCEECRQSSGGFRLANAGANSLDNSSTFI